MPVPRIARLQLCVREESLSNRTFPLAEMFWKLLCDLPSLVEK